ncbi:MAG TPA: hypothetical protein VHU41_07470 [Thermoanaerobaculia bacterium]|jgi:hypothetical protein|nr:hypothetical protein [Thermoanaerobaculia bacterium]
MIEAFLERDENRIRAAISDYRKTHTSDELFLDVARFAVMAYAPSQHSKHALFACLSAHDIREECGDRWDSLLAECAIYAAQSRQPWSEPPILDAPPIEPDQRGDVEELRAAVAEGDRLRAERWLAKRIDDPDLERDYFAVAADDFEDFGHKVIVARAAWRLAEILGEKGRFAILRVGVWEMCAYKGSRYEERGTRVDLSALVDNALAEGGSLEAMHHVFLFDAAAGTPVEKRAGDYLGSLTMKPGTAFTSRRDPPVYRLARDYGSYLKSFAVTKRLRDIRILDAAKYNLEHGASFEEYSFA